MSDETKLAIRDLAPAEIDVVSGAMSVVLWDGFGAKLSMSAESGIFCWSVATAGQAYGECTIQL